jgi:hypothetical protein
MMTKELINRRRALSLLCTSGVAAALIERPTAVRAATDEIELAKLPAKVRRAADLAVPGATWSNAYKDDEDGELVYEIDGKDRQKRSVTVEVSAQGDVNEVETEIPFKEVRENVQAALKKKMPRFKVSAAFEIREDGKVAGYNFEGKRPRDKEDIVVFVSVDGKEVEIDVE